MVDSPHVEVGESDISYGNDVRATDDDWAARNAVVDCAGPVVECEAAEGDCSSVGGSVGLPVLVDVCPELAEESGSEWNQDIPRP